MDVKLCYLRFIGGVFIFMMKTLCAVAAFAQDFEPDRRPEANLYLSVGWNPGSATMLGQKQSGLNTVGTPATFNRAFSTMASSYYWTTDDSVYRTFPVSVSSWVRTNQLLNNVNGRAFAHGYWNNSREVGTFTFFQDGYAKTFTQNDWTFVSGAGSGAVYTYGPQGIELGRWYHIVITHDGTTRRLYIDGSLADTQTGNSESVACFLGIGCGWYNATGTVGDRTNQSLYDFRIYRDTALTAAEVASLYNSTKGSAP